MTIKKKHIYYILGLAFMILATYYFYHAHSKFTLKSIVMFLVGVSYIVYATYLNKKI